MKTIKINRKILKPFRTALPILMLFTALSCSKDDNPEKLQLLLSASAMEIEVGQKITFEVKAGNQDVSDAVIYINDQPISGYSHSFEKKGNYTVAAKKNDSQSSPLTIVVLQSEERDVYVAGYESNGTNTIAKYWKNGEEIALTDGTRNAKAEAMHIVNNDVYIAGSENQTQSNWSSVGKYWKNGTDITNGEPGAFATSIFVVDNDVYMTGYESESKVLYWKNGEAVYLSGESDYSKSFFSIFVSGKDVYVAGYESGPGPTYASVAKYWKNGKGIALSDGSQSAYAKAIFVSDNDVYIAGTEADNSTGRTIAKYWKNGEAMTLTGKGAFGDAIYVVDGDVYIAGGDSTGDLGKTVAKYWKNREEVLLTTDKSKSAIATSIYVVDGDVYVGGYEENDQSKKVAKYWKNGVEIKLTDGSQDARATAIWVVDRKTL